MNYFVVSALVNFATSIMLGVFVVFKKRSSLNFKFALFCVSVAVWSAAYFFWQSSGDIGGAFFWLTILSVASSFIPVCYFLFSLAFLSLEVVGVNKIIMWIGLIIALSTIPMSIQGMLIAGIDKKLFFEYWPTAGSYYWVTLATFLSIVGYTIVLFYRSYKKEVGYKKQQILLLLLGTGFGFIGGITNFPLWYDIPLPPYGNILVSLYVAFTTYAILKHHLLDIKLVARRYSVYLASLATILVVAGGLRFLFLAIFKQNNIFFDITILMVSLTIAPFLKDYYYHFANQYLFSSLYDPQEIITHLSDKLRSTIEVKKIFQHITATLTRAFHAKNIAILLFVEKKKYYELRFNTGFPLTTKTMKLDGDLHSFFVAHDEPIALNDLQSMIDRSQQGTVKILKNLGVEFINPLNIKDKAVGLILMARKESGDTYNDEDSKVLSVIGTQAAIALENALLFEETKKFTVTLKKEVAQATEELRDKNEKLEKLDQMKTEFVSVASHQLRTPLTATKWALEYLRDSLESHATTEEKESLSELSVVNAKLIKLVNELLNISRIEEGRVRIDPKPVDLVRMVKTNVKEFMPLARQQKLKVREQYDELPMIALDEAVISKAVANFLSNAIKYNKIGGGLEVSIQKSGKNAVLTIRDEGIGIPKKEMNNLFQKFYRASNAVSSHTEGTGLGLYIAKNAIELSGGSLKVDSVEGQGTTIIMTLPLIGSKKIEGEKSLT